MANTFGQKKRGINMYIIQTVSPRYSDNWIDFDTAEDVDKAELRYRWIKHYYKDDTFRLIKESVDG